MEPLRGYILHLTVRNRNGVPVVHLFGRLDGGESFEVQCTQARPYFYVRETDRARWASALPRDPMVTETAVDRTTFAGDDVVRLEFTTVNAANDTRRTLEAREIECFEADLRLPTRFLIDLGIRGGIEIRGGQQSSGAPRVGRVIVDPELAPSDHAPAFSCLSFDIETDRRGQAVWSIALAGTGFDGQVDGASVDEVLVVSDRQEDDGGTVLHFPDEASLLRHFAARVIELDPDIITGWNILDFDLPVLKKAMGRARLRMELGRTPGEIRLPPKGQSAFPRAGVIAGRAVLDGIALLRSSFVRMQSYALGAVAKEVLGEGKTIDSDDRVGEIERLYREELPRFIAYNRRDATLVLEILERLDLLALTVERSRLTGMPLERVASSIASFDYLYLSELRHRPYVAPSGRTPRESSASNLGGQVFEPTAGLHDRVAVFDFKSLYPSLIRTFQIDPLGLVRDANAEVDAIVAPNRAGFRREPAILPQILDRLVPRREAAIARGDRVASQAIKILMNSFYGVLGAPACRFHDPRLANAITSFGRELLTWTRDRFEAHRFPVLYGDTDSVFVQVGEGPTETVEERAEEIRRTVQDELTTHIETTWRVESRLLLEFEKLYARLHLPEMRGREGGARKRYVGVRAGADATVEFVGMEAVRSDWTDLARGAQRELYERLFRGEPIADYVRELADLIHEGREDARLVYRKRLRRALSSYTRTTPPHVAAARKARRPVGRTIEYVMTTDGPEPVGEVAHPLDYDHYLEKQLRAVAEPVLHLVGIKFTTLFGGYEQLDLFE